MSARPTILVLGAAGLIGEATARHLAAAGFPVVAAARRLSAAQRLAFGTSARIVPLVDLDAPALAQLLTDTSADLVVNCIGVLQDGGGSSTGDVHAGFVSRLLEAIAAQPRPVLLVHLSVPGRPEEDGTAFSRTKREAERRIEATSIPFVILRPGFVIGDAAFGGSALMRALVTLPIALPAGLAARPFAATRIADIGATIAHLAVRRAAGEREQRATFDVMEATPSDVGDVLAAFRARFGGVEPRLVLPSWLLALGSRAGDAAALLGWRPPIRTTALREMQRGVAGDPGPWMRETGLVPPDIRRIVADLPATVQERWFARLYLLKAAILGGLSLFWIVSGAIALWPAFDSAAAILVAQGVPHPLAAAITAVTSLADITIGLAIATRRWSGAGLKAGIALTLGYMAGAVVLTPTLWLDPLGAMVKTVPALILMLVALALLDDRG